MRRDDFSFVFIGKEGSELTRLQQMAKGLPVIFLCNVPRADTVAAFHGADLFVLGSLVEAAPLVIMEAMAAQTPFISTDCGNVAEMKGGVICAPAAMAANANRLLDDASLRADLARDGHRQVREQLSWESVVDRYEDLYLKLHHAKIHGLVQTPTPTGWRRRLDTIDQGIDTELSNVELYLKAARTLVDARQETEARKYIEDALELDPDHVEALSLYRSMGAKP
jgi:hypothetical protein